LSFGRKIEQWPENILDRQERNSNLEKSKTVIFRRRTEKMSSEKDSLVEYCDPIRVKKNDQKLSGNHGDRLHG